MGSGEEDEHGPSPVPKDEGHFDFAQCRLGGTHILWMDEVIGTGASRLVILDKAHV